MRKNKQKGSICIHGGFSDELIDDWDTVENKRMALVQIIREGYEFLETDAPVVEVASHVIKLAFEITQFAKKACSRTGNKLYLHI